MTGSRFHCDAPTRRALIVGLGAGAPLLALMAGKPGRFDKRLPAGVSQVGDLVDSEGRATPAALARDGQTVAVLGFYAPALRVGALFDLYEGAAGPCLACGLLHDPGASLTVRGKAAPANVSALARLEIAGRLEIDQRGAVAIVI